MKTLTNGVTEFTPPYKPTQEFLVLEKMAEYQAIGKTITCKLLYQNLENMNDNAVSRVLNNLLHKKQVQKSKKYPAAWTLVESPNHVIGMLRDLRASGRTTIPGTPRPPNRKKKKKKIPEGMAKLADGMAHATPQQQKELNQAMSARLLRTSKQSAKQTVKRDLIRELDDLPPIANNAIDAVSELIKENRKLRTALRDVRILIDLNLGE